MRAAVGVTLTVLLLGGCGATAAEDATGSSAAGSDTTVSTSPAAGPTRDDPADAPSPSGGGIPGVEGVSWYIATYTTETPAEIIVASPPAGTRPLVGMTDGRLTLDVGCNEIVGDVAVTADTITATDVTTTDLPCTAPTREMEALLTGAFAQPVTYVRNGRGLNLTGGGVTLNLLPADEDPPTAAVTTG